MHDQLQFLCVFSSILFQSAIWNKTDIQSIIIDDDAENLINLRVIKISSATYQTFWVLAKYIWILNSFFTTLRYTLHIEKESCISSKNSLPITNPKWDIWWNFVAKRPFANKYRTLYMQVLVVFPIILMLFLTLDWITDIQLPSPSFQILSLCWWCDNGI